jgi:hypothetical protein
VVFTHHRHVLERNCRHAFTRQSFEMRLGALRGQAPEWLTALCRELIVQLASILESILFGYLQALRRRQVLRGTWLSARPNKLAPGQGSQLTKAATFPAGAANYGVLLVVTQ